MQTADSLRKIFGCKDDNELGQLFGRTGGAVSVWRKKGLPATIERKAQEIMNERGIVAESSPAYGDPLRVELEKEIDKLGRAELAELLSQLLKKARERDD